MIALGILLGIIGAITGILLIKYGIKYCNKNNAIGVVMLFISLNILGLVIGGAILGNIKNNNNEILRGKLMDYLDKQIEEKIKK